MIASQCDYYLNELPLGDKGKPGTLRHLAFVIGDGMYDATKYAAKDVLVPIPRK